MSRQQTLDYSVDVLRVLLWQYNEADNLHGLLQFKKDYYNENQRDFWQDWLINVFDLRTCNLFGISVWSKILNFPLTLSVNKSPNNYPAFSFSDVVGISDSPIKNFLHSNFATPANEYENLSIIHNRMILQLRYFDLITDGSVSHINRILDSVFGERIAFIRDNKNMTITYVFKNLDARLRLIMTELDILPRPSGVSYTIETINDQR